MREMMQNTPLGVFLVMLAFPLAMAGLLVYAAVRARRTAAAVESATPEPIGMASDGYRRFEGRAEAINGETLRAPLTGAACVWYDARLERWTYSAATRSSSWQTVRAVTSSAPVLVRDGTGACVVHTWSSEVTPTDKSRWVGRNPEPDDRNPPRFGPTQSSAEGLEISGGANKYRYTESRIYPGDALLVVGQFSSGRFAASDDEDDDEEEDDDRAELDPQQGVGEAEPSEADPWTAYAEERAEALHVLSARVTRAWVGPPGDGRPMVLANSTAKTHVAMNEMGAQAALYIALVPLGLAALLLLARFG